MPDQAVGGASAVPHQITAQDFRSLSSFKFFYCPRLHLELPRGKVHNGNLLDQPPRALDKRRVDRVLLDVVGAVLGRRKLDDKAVRVAVLERLNGVVLAALDGEHIRLLRCRVDAVLDKVEELRAGLEVLVKGQLMWHGIWGTKRTHRLDGLGVDRVLELEEHNVGERHGGSDGGFSGLEIWCTA